MSAGLQRRGAGGCRQKSGQGRRTSQRQGAQSGAQKVALQMLYSRRRSREIPRVWRKVPKPVRRAAGEGESDAIQAVRERIAWGEWEPQTTLGPGGGLGALGSSGKQGAPVRQATP